MNIRSQLALFGLFLGAIVSQSEAAPITSLLGDVHLQPTAWNNQFNNVGDVESWNGTLYIAGDVSGMPTVVSMPMEETATSAVSAMQTLSSPNTSDPRGMVLDITVVDGQVMYGGYTRGSLGNLYSTTWDTQGASTGHGSNAPTADSVVQRVSSGGQIAGDHFNADPAVGLLNSQLTALPILGGGGVARDISDDGRVIVGADGFTAAVWRSSDPMSLNYQLDSVALQLTPDGAAPDFFTHVFDGTSIGEVAFGQYLDLTIGNEAVGAWNLNSGNFLGLMGYGQLADAKMFNDTLVLGINGGDGGYLTTFDSPDVTIDLASLFPNDLGLANVTLAKGGLYDGSLGFLSLAQGVGGVSMLATTSFNVTSTPEPSSLLLLALGAGGIGRIRRRRHPVI